MDITPSALAHDMELNLIDEIKDMLDDGEIDPAYRLMGFLRDMRHIWQGMGVL